MNVEPSAQEQHLISLLRAHVPDATTSPHTVPDHRRSIDHWREVLRLARFHRVEGLLINRLDDEQANPEIKQIIAEFIGTVRHKILESMARSRATAILATELLNTGIDLVLLKSEAISSRYYAHPSHRTSRDIDFLINGEDFPVARQVLLDMGYSPTRPSFDIPAGCLSAVQTLTKDASFVHKELGTIVELHWRPFDNPELFNINPANFKAGFETIRIANQPVCVLSGPAQLVYLMIHGAMHDWFRLKWLVDVNRIVRHLSQQEISQARKLARSFKVEQLFEEGLALHQIYFGGDLQPLMQTQSSTGARVSEVERYTNRIQQAVTSKGHRSLRDFGDVVAQYTVTFRMLPGIRYKFWHFVTRFADLDHVQKLKLSRRWLPLYVVTGIAGRTLIAISRLFFGKAH